MPGIRGDDDEQPASKSAGMLISGGRRQRGVRELTE